MSTDYEDRAVEVDDDSVAPWEPGGAEYVVLLRGELDDRWVESYVLTRRRSARFARFHLNRARGRVSFLCRESDNPEELGTVLANLKLLVAQTNRRAFTRGWESDAGTGGDAATQEAPSELGEETIATHVPRTHAAERFTAEIPEPDRAPDADAPLEATGHTVPIDRIDAADTTDPNDPEPIHPIHSTEPAVLSDAPDSSEPETPDSPPSGPAEQEPAPPPGPGASDRVLEAITASLGRLETPADPRKARARLAQWMGTASLVVEDGGSEDELVAAVFAAGDFDAGTPPDVLQEIGEKFGERVASLVKACDEAYAVLRPGGDPRLWSLFLRHTPVAARRIVCASRLRSARALLATYRRLDVARRLSFRDENRATLHDYRSVVEAFLEAGYSSHLVDVLDGVVLEMELAAGPASAERRQKRPLDRLTDELMQKVDLMEE